MKIALTVVVAALFVAIAWRASPTTTAAVGVAWALVGRAFTTTVIFPEPLLVRSADFFDFVLIPLALLAAIVRGSGSDRAGIKALWRSGRGFWVAGLVFLGVCLGSSTANGLGLVRGFADWLFLAEPFLLVAAVVISKPTARTRQRVVRLLTVLLLAEFATMTAQAVRARAFGPVPGYPVWQDYVTGTMFGSRVGAHILPAAVLLLALVVSTQRDSPRLVRWGAPVLSIVFLGVADDKQMLLVSPVVVIVFVLVRSMMTSARVTRRAVVLATLGAGVALGAGAIYVMTFGNGYGVSILSRTLEGGGKATVDQDLVDNTFATARTTIIGAGPGATISRLAALTLPQERRAGSPTSVLGLQPTAEAVHYNDVATKLANGGVSDLLSPTSSFFGIVGDLGLAGLLAYAALWVNALRRLLAATSPLRAVAAAGWVALVPLGVVFDWFEQPAYTLVLALITGLAIVGSGRDDILGLHAMTSHHWPSPRRDRRPSTERVN